ncbi:MAG: DUF2256 domain-containing protein [Phycisphaerales bacterium]
MSKEHGEGGVPADKFCAVCGRRIEWRKKWERDWASVRACSDRCKRAGWMRWTRVWRRACGQRARAGTGQDDLPERGGTACRR